MIKNIPYTLKYYLVNANELSKGEFGESVSAMDILLTHGKSLN